MLLKIRLLSIALLSFFLMPTSYCMKLGSSKFAAQQPAIKTIKISTDNKEYILTNEQASKCITLKNMLDDLEDNDEAIPLPISSTLFDYICADLTEITYEVTVIPDEIIVKLLKAANFLDCTDLITKYSAILFDRATQNLTKDNLFERRQWLKKMITIEDLTPYIAQALINHPLTQNFIATPLWCSQLPRGVSYFSPDSSKITIYSFEHLSIYNAHTGQLLWELEERCDDILFSQNKTLLAYNNGYESPTSIALYDVETGTKFWQLKKQICDITIREIMFLPNSHYILAIGEPNDSSDEDNDILLMIDAKTGLILWQKSFENYDDVDFSPSGNEVLVYNKDFKKKVFTLDVFASKDGSSLCSRNGIVKCTFSPDNNTVIATQEHTVSLYSNHNTQQNTLVWEIYSNRLIQQTFFSPDSTKIFLIYDDNTFSVYDAKTGTLLWHKKEYDRPIRICNIALSADSKKVILHWRNTQELHNHNEIKIYSLEDGTVLKNCFNPGILSDNLLFHCVIDSANKSLSIQELQSNKSILKLSYIATGIPSFCTFSPDNNKLLMTPLSPANRPYIIQLKDDILPKKLCQLSLDEVLVLFYIIQAIVQLDSLSLDQDSKNVYLNLEQTVKLHVKQYIKQQVFE